MVFTCQFKVMRKAIFLTVGTWTSVRKYCLFAYNLIFTSNFHLCSKHKYNSALEHQVIRIIPCVWIKMQCPSRCT